MERASAQSILVAVALALPTATARPATPGGINALLCDPKGWNHDGRFVSITRQTAHVHGSGPGLLFAYTRRSRDLWDANGKFVNQAYRPQARKELASLDLSGYDDLSFWIYVEGNAEELIKIGFGREVGLRVCAPRGEWVHARWNFRESARLNRSAVTRVSLHGVNQGTPPGDPQQARIYLSDFRLEKAPPRHLTGWAPDPGEIVLPYCGVYPKERVAAIVAAKYAGKSFRCEGSGASSTGKVSGVKQNARCQYAELALRAPAQCGDYRVAIEDSPAAPLLVRQHPYDEAISKALTVVRAQRCGCASELHGPCHLDDGVRADNGEAVDVSGGWHDEGVYQISRNTMKTARDLARLRRSHGRAYRLGLNENGVDDLLAEVDWGARTALKYEMAPGRYYMLLKHPGWYHTDNRPGTGDERGIDCQRGGCRALQLDLWLRIETLALCAQTCREPLKNQLRAAAERAWAHAARIAQSGSEREKEVWAEHSKNTLHNAFHLAAAVEMVRLTRKGKYADEAVRVAAYLLRLQETTRSASDGLYGYFVATMGKTTPFVAKREDVPGRALADLLMAMPTHADAPHWRRALARYAEGTLKPLARVNAPYGYPAAGPFERSVAKRPSITMGEKLGDMLVSPIHFYESAYKDQVNSNESALLLKIAAQAGAMGRALDDDELLAIAHNAIRYLLGANPFHLSCMRRFGERWPVLAQLPSVEGMILGRLGFTWDGRPYYNPYGAGSLKGHPHVRVQKEGATHVPAALMAACSYFE